jgi:CHAT domain-containing protein/tetratricopeptide (TPR) repeat protein
MVLPGDTRPLERYHLHLSGTLGTPTLEGEVRAPSLAEGAPGCHVDAARVRLALHGTVTAEQYATNVSRYQLFESVAQLTALLAQPQAPGAADLQQRILVRAEQLFGDRDGRLVNLLTSLAQLQYGSGHAAEAFPLLRRAIALCEQNQVAEFPQQANLQLTLGAYLVEGGHYAEAEPLLRRALAIQSKALGPDSAQLVPSLYTLGRALTQMGQYVEAETQLRRAVALADTAKPDPQLGQALVGLADLLRITGRFAEAEALLRRVLAVDERNFGPESYQVARDVEGLANLFTYQHRFAEAEPLHRRVVGALRKLEVPNSNNLATELNNLGVDLLQLHRYAEAEPLFRQALNIYERNFGPDDANGGRTRMNLGQLLQFRGDYAGAERELLRAYRIVRTAGLAPPIWRVPSYLMDLYRDPGRYHPDLAIFFGKQAVNTLQSLRANLAAGREAQHSFVETAASTYHTLADMLIQAGRLSEAQEVLAMLKEQEFYEFTQRGGDVDPGKTVASLDAVEGGLDARSIEWIRRSQEYGALQERFRKEGDAFRNGPDYPRLQQLRAAMDDAESAFNQALSAIAEASSHDSQAQQDRLDKLTAFSTSIRSTLGALGQGAVLVQYVVLEDKLDILLTTPLISVAREVAVRHADLNALIFAYRDTLQNRAADPLPKAQALYKLLVAPVEPELRAAGARMLMLSLDDTLRYLPFAALHDGQGFLLERYTLAMTTPQTLDKLASQDPTRVHPDWSVWGLGVTQGHMIEATHESFVPLPMVGAELSAIVGPGGVLAGKVLLDPQFDENSLRDGLEQGYPIIHIASHFKFDPASTDRSFLLLGDGKPLSLTRISTLNFSHVELLTLSACETALGGDGAADHGTEVESLGGIAQRRGAQAVLATLWSVNDSSTALFMHAFYHDHQEQKLGKAAALRQAQLALLHGTVQVAVLPEPVRGARLVAAPPAAGEFKPDPKAPFAHPYYWAPFILMGNWQ